MASSSEVERQGYLSLAKLFRRLAKTIGKVSSSLTHLSERLYFENYKIQFGERDDDIYIVTYPKSGTTLVQMILYHLTTDGKMDFQHIYEVSPWIRNDSFKRIPPRELKSPRIIKTHDKYHYFPKGTKGKFLFVYRDGKDVAVSHFHQNKNYNNPNLTFDLFAESFLKKKSWFKFCNSWFKNKNQFQMLVLKYEDLLANKREEIDRIISFLDIHPSAKQIDNAVHFSSFEYMKENELKFGDQPREDKRIFDQFIRKGKSGEGAEYFKDDHIKQFNAEHKKYIEKHLNDINA